MKRSLAVHTVLIMLLAGCATQQPWRPTVDTYGSSQAQYVHRDMEECRQLALQVSGDTGRQAATGAVTGGLVGAAAGAAIGSAFGSAGRGAMVGGAVGGIGRGVQQASRAESSFQQAYVNCMRQRGHRVIN